jgi:hypothetical protein
LKYNKWQKEHLGIRLAQMRLVVAAVAGRIRPLIGRLWVPVPKELQDVVRATAKSLGSRVDPRVNLNSTLKMLLDSKLDQAPC